MDTILQPSQKEIFDTLFIEAQDAIFVVDTENAKIIDTNPEVERLFGYEKSDLLGKHFSFLFDTNTPETVSDKKNIEFYDSVANSQEFMRADGQRVYIDLTVNPVSWSGIDAILVSCRDVCERKLAQDEIQRRKKELSIILQSIGDGIIAVDSASKIIFFNSKACDFFAIDIEIGANISDVIKYCKNQEQLLLDINKNEFFSGLEVEVEYPLPRTLSIIGNSFNSKDSSMNGKIFAIRNITREKEIVKMKDDFVANISLELRSPLTAIIGFTSTILNNSMMDDTTRESFLNIIQAESRRLLEMVEKVLNISGIETGKLYYSMKKLNISRMIDNIKDRILQEASKKSVNLEFQIAKKLPSLIADEEAISRVILNLCENAIKYSADQTHIRVDIGQQDNQILIQVSDNGIGISPENLGKIFDKFYRIHNSITTVPGIGIGLYIAKKIVERHHGTIQVQSEVDKGSVFSVFLPIDYGGFNE